MSSLLSGSARSDSPSVLNVHGCAVGRALDSTGKTVVAGFHTRLTGSTGSNLLAVMERGMKDRIGQMDRHTEEFTIAGVPLTMHSVGSHQLLYMVITRAEYPHRVVFGRAAEMEAGFAMSSLLPQLASETSDQVSLSLAQGPTTPSSGSSVRRVVLPSRAVQAMERVCAGFESPRNYDTITDVQAQVDDVTGLMRDNVNQILHNSEQLSILSDKADVANSQAGYFSKAAREARQHAQCQEYKMRAVIAGVVLVGVWILYSWIF
mmetsp:Transcript_39796/g.84835  ORF Transcript_39796/g.84835 Transcript_39796/m.84835 type:complete len:263 (-) Transcript_39796:786-1574(-)